jgi:murein DD-endopeptidase MepM/ murein hydrolase activator NlpD
VLAAEFTNRGNTFQAFRYTYPDTKETDYFNSDGDSLRREFLKSPFKYTPRITSRFSYNRLHPVRKVYRPHYGVDYAAKVGTPVHSTADGTVLFAGWNGASGRMIRIRHKNNYETMYLHLRRCYVKKGERIKGGERIGEVGISGEVSGPHLDYRIKYGGKYINPLSHRFKPVKPLRSEFLEDFILIAKNYSLYFDAPLIIFSAF